MSNAITFYKTGDFLILKYDQADDSDWIDEKLIENGPVTIRKIFTFDASESFTSSSEGQLGYEDQSSEFVFGRLEGDYFRIDKSCLALKYDLLIQKDIKIDYTFFVAHRRISIFKKIDKISDEQIIIGGAHQNAIPFEEFNELLRSFPNSTELDRYASSRISRILRYYLQSMDDHERKLEVYMGRKNQPHRTDAAEIIKHQKIPEREANKIWFRFEVQKYEFIRDQIKQMLEEYEAYTKKQWQYLMLDFILLIFPKYIKCFKEFPVKDFYFNPDLRPKRRSIDFALIDADGNLDLVEIKKPLENSILSKSRSRDNYVPKRELSETVMQVEKYIFHLNKWGIEGEKRVNEKYKKDLPTGLKINFTNPKALLILGRSHHFEREQKLDYEIIKRKYSNIVDIITYDDLLQRLDNTIEKFAGDYMITKK